MENKNNCFVCKEELIYINEFEKMECIFCKDTFESNAKCKSGHFVCDSCHSASAIDFITTYCKNSNKKNPTEIANEIMAHPSVKMHGPEHHYLVPAALLTAYFNIKPDTETFYKKLEQANKRAQNVLGGYCGFFGACGAGIGTGIFMSLITNATPLSEEVWKLSNMCTATSIQKIAESGGPRCCKRDTFIAIEEATKFVKTSFDIDMETTENIICSFRHLNKECIKENCDYFK